MARKETEQINTKAKRSPGVRSAENRRKRGSNPQSTLSRLVRTQTQTNRRLDEIAQRIEAIEARAGSPLSIVGILKDDPDWDSYLATLAEARQRDREAVGED